MPAPAPTRPSLARRVLVAASSAALPPTAAAALALGLELDAPWSLGLVVGVGLPLGLALALLLLRPTLRAFAALKDGVQAFEEGDFSLRLPSGREDEVGGVYQAVNRVGDVLREERLHLHQKEWMLETVLQSTPMAILLVGERRRVVYSNRAARRLLAEGERLEGHALDEVLARAPEALGEHLREGQDALFRIELGGREESFHLSQRVFQLHTRPHTLITLRRMTPELRRQEVAVWKKVIRVMSHELNNSLAPIASLAHSARKIVHDREHVDRLEDVFETIEERARHLKEFLEGYARFARLPRPNKEDVALGPFVQHVLGLTRFRLLGPPPEGTGRFDAAQLEQVLINLSENAEESGSAPEEVTLAVRVEEGGGLRFLCRDRGRGMTPEELEAALVPFHSSKKGGTGLGLALCQEILEAHGGSLQLANREGGGVRVTCRLPAKGSSLG